MSVKLGRNDPCWCGSGKKYKACHAAFDDKLARLAQEGHVVPTPVSYTHLTLPTKA